MGPTRAMWDSFRDLMMEVPEDVNAPYSLADCLVAMKRYAEAIPILQRLTSLDPTDADALNLLATAHLARGEYQDALFCYRRTVRLAPNDPVELTNYAATLMALGHDEEAVEVARKALSLRPHAATAFNLGDALIRLKRCTEAIGPLREALTLEPGNDDTRVVLASALTGAGQYGQAAEVLREVSNASVNGPALALLSHIHQKRGRTVESIEAARAALRATPTLPQAYRGLGFALLVGGHYSEALEAFREVQRLDPSDVSAELGTGASLTALGEHQAASAAFARALQSRTGRPRGLSRDRAVHRREHRDSWAGDGDLLKVFTRAT